MRVVAQRFDGPAVTLTGWPAVVDPPVVLTSGLARRIDVEVGERLSLVLDGSVTRVEVAQIVRRVPTAGGAPAVVVDQALLARALAQRGVAGSAVDEWWVDPGADRIADDVAALGTDREVTSQLGLTTRMQEHPLRVAIRGDDHGAAAVRGPGRADDGDRLHPRREPAGDVRSDAAPGRRRARR